MFESLEKVWVADIDGKGMTKWKDYADAIEKAFKFPTPCDKSYDVYLDWIRDLVWLDANEYVLIVRNYKEFLKNDIELKEEITNDFSEIIIPWWQQEVEKYEVGGKAKPFMVYLVD